MGDINALLEQLQTQFLLAALCKGDVRLEIEHAEVFRIVGDDSHSHKYASFTADPSPWRRRA